MPSRAPSGEPSRGPTTSAPSCHPTTTRPSGAPSAPPTSGPPTAAPSGRPSSSRPSAVPTLGPATFPPSRAPQVNSAGNVSEHSEGILSRAHLRVLYVLGGVCALLCLVGLFYHATRFSRLPRSFPDAFHRSSVQAGSYVVLPSSQSVGTASRSTMEPIDSTGTPLLKPTTSDIVVPQCRNGHDCYHLFDTPYFDTEETTASSVFCNECGKYKIDKEARGFYHCRTCRYDRCVDCFIQRGQPDFAETEYKDRQKQLLDFSRYPSTISRPLTPIESVAQEKFTIHEKSVNTTLVNFSSLNPLGQYGQAKCFFKKLSEPSYLNYLNEGSLFFRISVHMNICRVYGFYNFRRVNYLVLDYCQYGSVLDVMESEAFSFKDKANVCRQIASAVGALHKEDVIHADIGLQRCLVRNMDVHLGIVHVVLTDFSISRRFPCSRKVEFLRPRWCAPELRETRIPTFATDIWALGCTFWELHAESKPFPSIDDKDLDRLLNSTPNISPPPDREWPTEIKHILKLMFVTDATKRIVASDLEHVCEAYMRSQGHS